jgi:hypothetical protein
LPKAAAKAARNAGRRRPRLFPNADQKSVRKAVRDANIVIYFGHGVGHAEPVLGYPEPGER